MTDRTDAIDDVPEGDLVEQSAPAYLEDDADNAEFLSAAADREANEADVIEQAMEVPVDEDYGEDSGDEY